MRILQITETADTGGAEVCARMLHDGLLAAGHEVWALVGHTTRQPDERIRVMRPQSLLSRFAYHSLNMFGLNYLGILNAGAILRHPFLARAEVVHLHNIHGGYFNYLTLMKLSALKAVVWTLHDMWGLTGHCAHSFDCERWKTGCGGCPYPAVYPPVRMDNTRLDWRLKKRVYDRSRLALICPSRWLTDLTRQSSLRRFPVNHVPNGVDTEGYRPGNGDACRRELGIPEGKRVLLANFPGADNPFKDHAVFLAAIELLDPALKSKSVVVTMGRDEPAGDRLAGMPVLRLGFVRDEARKAAAYRAADVFAYATRADNQPMGILEAMSCGCPVVSSSVGGVPELVRTGETGYLAEPGDADDFRRGIEGVLGDDALRRRMAERCRETVVRNHDVRLHVARTTEVYAETLESWKGQHARD